MSKRRRRKINQLGASIPLAFLAAILLLARCQPEESTTTKDYAGLEAEVVAWYRDNFETPIAMNQPFVESVSKLYAPPLHYLDLNEEYVLDDEKKVREFIQGFSDWRGESPNSSAEVSHIRVQMLNDTGASLVADWRFNDADGRALGESDPVQYFYLLSKQEPGWRVVGEATVAGGARIRW